MCFPSDLLLDFALFEEFTGAGVTPHGRVGRGNPAPSRPKYGARLEGAFHGPSRDRHTGRRPDALLLAVEQFRAAILPATFLPVVDLHRDHPDAVLFRGPLGVHDRDAGAGGLAAADVRHRAAGRGGAAGVAANACAAGQQPSQLVGRGDSGAGGDHDRFVRVPLEEGVFRAGEIPGDVCGQPGGRGDLLLHPGDMVLEYCAADVKKKAEVRKQNSEQRLKRSRLLSPTVLLRSGQGRDGDDSNQKR